MGSLRCFAALVQYDDFFFLLSADCSLMTDDVL